MDEIRAIEQKAGDITGKLVISKRAHLILPTHRMLDAASEAAKGKSKIGSTLKGIGPTYMDKTGRNGLRIGDILSPEFLNRYNSLKKKHFGLLAQYDFQYDITEYEKQWMQAVEDLKRFPFIESELVMNQYLQEGMPVLAEGAQGSMLDIDFGTYPFVTSSNTMTAGVCTGLGVAPNRVGKVFGIFKAYCTRVGSGPFPTELFDEEGESLRQIGHEFGATTGRPRRCGWLDLVALKYAVMMNGVSELIMMKADVLNSFKTIKVATAYEIGGKHMDYFPFESGEEVTPVYKEFPGWECDICAVRDYADFPRQLKDYIDFIEKETGCPVKIISVGPDREAVVVR
jgi:adenylosuccinate synthase